MAVPKNGMSQKELEEEIAFFRDYCGYSDERIEARLGLATGTMEQRRLRSEKRQAAA